MSARARTIVVGSVFVVAAVAVGRLSGVGDGGSTSTTATAADSAAPASPTTAAGGHDPAGQVSDLPAGSVDDLPPEALDTLALIESDGPYPYEQDDGVFGNREGLLPDRGSGYYREYTVETPGSDDRGARRLIVGADGEVYYTDDHYESFVEVVDAHR